MDVSAPQDDTATAPGEVSYAYKASLLGAPFEFRLTPTGLAWSKGRFSGTADYGQIRRIRLSYRPVTMQSQRYVAEIWPVAAPKLQIASTSLRNLVEQERFDDAYRAFIVELHRRIAEAGGQTLFESGSPPALFWPGIVISLGLLIVLVVLTGHALLSGAAGAAAVVGAILALLLWQMGPFFWRNRPGTYRPDALPAAVLPPASLPQHQH